MDQSEVAVARAAARVSRFELAPPRHFLLPAILLLLSEEPGYGYGLVKELRGFRFGSVDRPSVYRALAQLEGDGLVESWPGEATAGQTRRVYGLTPEG
ncbi:MAG TPA: helix-turn-helix transcriptional regulator, partial [Acidimicrobiales bacterium]